MSRREKFIAADWTKSTASGGSDCVEVARVEDVIGVRDSKDPGGPILEFTIREWKAFGAGMAAGEFAFLDA